jgi:Tol biopolymer transport system component
MAFESNRTGKRLVWTKDLETGKEMMLSAQPSKMTLPSLSPDGTIVAYSVIDREMAAFVAPFTGGTPREAAKGCVPGEWTTDGRAFFCGARGRIDLVDLESGQRWIAAEHPTMTLWSPSLSPDGKWVGFSAIEPGPEQKGIHFLAPFRSGRVADQSEWVHRENGTWSPDGNRLWVVKGIDGYQCLWTVRLDPSTKQVVGDPAEVYHFHGARRSFANVPGAGGLALAEDKLVFTLGDLTGNIWMAERHVR